MTSLLFNPPPAPIPVTKNDGGPRVWLSAQRDEHRRIRLSGLTRDRQFGISPDSVQAIAGRPDDEHSRIVGRGGRTRRGRPPAQSARDAHPTDVRDTEPGEIELPILKIEAY